MMDIITAPLHSTSTLSIFESRKKEKEGYIFIKNPPTTRTPNREVWDEGGLLCTCKEEKAVIQGTAASDDAENGSEFNISSYYFSLERFYC